MGANEKAAATYHGRSPLEELKACAELTSAFPESEAEDVLARGTIDLIAALDAVRSIRESNAFEDYQRDYTAGYNDALEEVNARINEHLGES